MSNNRQIRITSADLRIEGDDPSIPDAYVSPDDPANVYANPLSKLYPLPTVAPTTQWDRRGTIQREQGIRPGTPAWFELWRGGKK